MSSKVKTHPELDAFMAHMGEINGEALSVKGMEAAIVGYVERIGEEPLIVYDRIKCLEILMVDDGLSEEDAIDHFEYNIIGAWAGKGTPVFLTTIDEAAL